MNTFQIIKENKNHANVVYGLWTVWILLIGLNFCMFAGLFICSLYHALG